MKRHVKILDEERNMMSGFPFLCVIMERGKTAMFNNTADEDFNSAGADGCLYHEEGVYGSIGSDSYKKKYQKI